LVFCLLFGGKSDVDCFVRGTCGVVSMCDIKTAKARPSLSRPPPPPRHTITHHQTLRL
jgi:hypothetical protein